VEDTRQKLFLQLFILATAVSLSLILTVYIASTYYKGVADLNAWTPVPTDTPTETLVPTKEPTLTQTPTTAATAVPTISKNCTYSALYWFYHPEAWPPQVLVGDLTYTKEDAIVTIQAPNPDSAAKLFTQLHAAILNSMSGADFEAVRQTTIVASEWLTEHPTGTQISEADQQAGLLLTKMLEDYNTGLTGPGRCPGEPAPPAPSSTPVPQFSPTPSETATETPVPPRQFIPTEAPKRTRPPATHPPFTNTPRPAATNTPRPAATNTPKPPTPVP
jgi:hypothetical protein